MNVAIICLQFLSCLIVSTFAQYPFQFTNPGSPVKRTYVLHRGANGEPRSMQDEFDKSYDGHHKEEMGNVFKRARDYLRFGKRMGEEEEDDGLEEINGDDMESPDMDRLYPYKRFGRRRMSNFLRFG